MVGIHPGGHVVRESIERGPLKRSQDTCLLSLSILKNSICVSGFAFGVGLAAGFDRKFHLHFEGSCFPIAYAVRLANPMPECTPKDPQHFPRAFVINLSRCRNNPILDRDWLAKASNDRASVPRQPPLKLPVCAQLCRFCNAGFSIVAPAIVQDHDRAWPVGA